MYLNLDTIFNPFGLRDSIKYESFTFKGGEPHIKITSDLELINEVFITTRIQSFNDIGLLLLAVDALRNMDVDIIHLMIPYFPAARQDRLMVSGEPLSVKVYANLINAQSFKTVTVFDPHSEVTPALLNRCKVIHNYAFISEVVKELPKDLLLVSPDGGALKKIYKLAMHLQDYSVIECSKVRDVKTGKLTSFTVYAEDLQGKDCLIVDDICDGGGTFLGLAQELKQKNAGKLYIAVSHGIFSKGFEQLNAQFEAIFTTNSFKSFKENDNVTVIDLKHLLK